MKNVLLATTALVAMAGAAAADVSWGGDAMAEYTVNGGVGAFTAAANLNVTATAELNNGVTAGLDWDFFGISTATGVSFVTLPVGWIESSMGKLSIGNASAIGGASDHYSATQNVGDFTSGSYTSSSVAVRADASFGGFDVSVSDANFLGGAPADLRFGASGSFGAVDLGLGYSQATGGFGMNVGTMLGGADIGVSYFSPTGEFGIETSYDMGNGVTLGAFYSSLPVGDYGVSLGYASGAMSVDVAWANLGSTTIDFGYDVNDAVALSAGYNATAGTAYLAANYDLGNGASVYGSYGTGYSKPIGITVGASIEF